MGAVVARCVRNACCCRAGRALRRWWTLRSLSVAEQQYDALIVRGSRLERAKRDELRRVQVLLQASAADENEVLATSYARQYIQLSRHIANQSRFIQGWRTSREAMRSVRFLADSQVADEYAAAAMASQSINFDAILEARHDLDELARQVAETAQPEEGSFMAQDGAMRTGDEQAVARLVGRFMDPMLGDGGHGDQVGIDDIEAMPLPPRHAPRDAQSREYTPLLR
jgi:hypothetical protein